LNGQNENPSVDPHNGAGSDFGQTSILHDPLAPHLSDEENAITPTSPSLQNIKDDTPEKIDDNKILIDWYSDSDPANPQNWSRLKKGFVLFQLCAYTMAVYGASSMYVPGEQGVMKEFNVGATPAALGLAMYVAGYGFGPLLFAPLSEIPAVGRNWVYIPTFFIFVILSIPTAVVKNFAGLLVLRFITGFFGSPCLANGGASVGDIVSLHYRVRCNL
jgi:DHA1 family multidrug resistance protein-like MFS transporter